MVLNIPSVSSLSVSFSSFCQNITLLGEMGRNSGEIGRIFLIKRAEMTENSGKDSSQPKVNQA